MLQLKHISLIFVLVLLKSTVSFGKQYKCTIYDNGQKCEMWGVQLTKSDYRIEPEANNLNAVTTCDIRGTVPVLSSGICRAMPNLKKLSASSVSMEEIERNALAGCKKLEKLDLFYNNFVKLDKNTFKGLTSLKQLRLYGGRIQEFDLDLTDQKELTQLGLEKLDIIVFPADILREQKNLKELFLYSNNLFDLDVEGILKYTPNLEIIRLSDNNFKCARLKEILTVLKEKNIKAEALRYALMQRNYKPDKIEGIHCLSDRQWQSEFAKFPLAQKSIVKIVPKKIEVPKTTPKPIEVPRTTPRKIEAPQTTPKSIEVPLTTPKTIEVEVPITPNTTAIDEQFASFDAKLEKLRKLQDGQISKLEGKLNEGLQTLQQQNKDLLESQDAKMSNLQGNMNQVLEILVKNAEDDKSTILQNSLNKGLESLDQKIGALQTTQNAQISNLQENLNKSLNTLDKKFEVQDNHISKLQKNLDKGLEAIDKKVGVQDKQISELQENVSKGLDTVNKKVEALKPTQDGKISNPQEYFDKSLATLGNKVAAQDGHISDIRETLNKGLEMLSQKLAALQALEEETKTKLQHTYETLYEKISSDLQKSQDEKMMKLQESCYKILEEKCMEDACLTF